MDRPKSQKPQKPKATEATKAKSHKSQKPQKPRKTKTIPKKETKNIPKLNGPPLFIGPSDLSTSFRHLATRKHQRGAFCRPVVSELAEVKIPCLGSEVWHRWIVGCEGPELLNDHTNKKVFLAGSALYRHQIREAAHAFF